MAIEKYDIPLLLGRRQEIITTPACLVTDDYEGYQFKFYIKNKEGYPQDLSWVTSASIKLAKPDGEVIIGTVDINNGALTYDLGTNEVAEAGYVLSTVQLYGDGIRLTTQIFKFEVIHEIVGESEIPSTSEYSILTDLIAQVQALYDAGAATTTYVDEQDAAVLQSANESIAQAISDLTGGTLPVELDTLYELANAIGNNPNFATEVAEALTNKVDEVEGKGLSTEDFTTVLKEQLESLVSEEGTLTNHLQIQQIRSNFIDSYARNYKEIIKNENDLTTGIQVWVDATKTTLLFTKTFTYIGEAVSEIVTTDHTNNKILTKTITYPSDSVTTITEVVSNGN